MRRHKAVARIFLFLSIVNFTFAGISQTPNTHEMRVDLVTGAQDVAKASSEMPGGHAQSAAEKVPGWLGRSASTAGHLQSRFDFIPAQSFSTDAKTVAGDPEKDVFFTEELKRKMKEYLILGTVAGFFTGIANGVQKEILGTVSPDAQTVGRAVDPSDELPQLPQDQKDPVSRSLSSMRDEDLQMLSIISRRMLKRHDRRAGGGS